VQRKAAAPVRLASASACAEFVLQVRPLLEQLLCKALVLVNGQPVKHS
jgi:hypothetical protein